MDESTCLNRNAGAKAVPSGIVQELRINGEKMRRPKQKKADEFPKELYVIWEGTKDDVFLGATQTVSKLKRVVEDLI